MKRYLAVFVLVILSIGITHARIMSDTLVLVQGIITDKETNEPISATLTYEKLPYYDDMGIAKSSSGTGHFRLHLVKSHQYSITVQADGYEKFNQDLLVTVYDGTLELE
ncbi:MAG: hypothetical protein O2887_00015 [Bacteroidetes bacterium]|nr:hypothetical protein [Bacteroidota bacterium]MDA1118875.1 hypothetical protein [Bacteroidota bacterium]